MENGIFAGRRGFITFTQRLIARLSTSRYLSFLFLLFLGFPIHSLRIAVIPDNAKPGYPLSVAVEGARGEGLVAKLVNTQGVISSAPLFDMNPRRFLRGNIVKAALLSVPSTAKSGRATLKIENNRGLLGESVVNIMERDFVSEVISLDKRNTEIRATPSIKKTEEAQKLWTILSRTDDAFYAAEMSFSPPVASTRRTSFFGDRRVYRYSTGGTDTAIHAGIDYGVPIGTPVKACASGRVVLAAFREATGNSIVLEHLPGVYSLYYHLSRLNVEEGAFVLRGDTLGESGMTGLATGPHLHWEIRIAGENTDPDVCILKPIFDSESLIRRLQE
ncbi:MAG: M23 family metallopeptidase [Treponema sp.]|jgi:murein DD-endopeptidase MepM/ murein hydrolase activator NlpD|nr:M23 family metallopeptidase [Treponema sp.]